MIISLCSAWQGRQEKKRRNIEVDLQGFAAVIFVAKANKTEICKRSKIKPTRQRARRARESTHTILAEEAVRKYIKGVSFNIYITTLASSLECLLYFASVGASADDVGFMKVKLLAPPLKMLAV
jgi:hypothetical protein